MRVVVANVMHIRGRQPSLSQKGPSIEPGEFVTNQSGESVEFSVPTVDLFRGVCGHSGRSAGLCHVVAQTLHNSGNNLNIIPG